MTRLTEKDLLELGFKKVKVSAMESGDVDYDFYSLDFWDDFPTFSLLAEKEDEINWSIYIFDNPRIIFKDKEQASSFINLIKNNIV